MASPRELALREHLANYLADVESPDDFKDWLVGATWGIDETGDRSAIALTYDIKLALAEHSSGHSTEDELRRELQPLVTADVRSPSTTFAE